jgi:hypothetical protein
VSGFQARPEAIGTSAARARIAPLRQAIERRNLVFANYRKKTLLLAPYAICVRGADLILDGVVVLEDGRAPSAPKLDGFALAELIAIARSDQVFAPDAALCSAAMQVSEMIVCAVAPDPNS